MASMIELIQNGGVTSPQGFIAGGVYSGLKTQESEFIYADVESPVPVDTTYSVYYLLDKSKVYYTKLITSKYVRKMIKVKNFDLYDEYTFIKSLKRETYPTSTYPAPSDSDYSRGIINRYFIQKSSSFICWA